jgi:protein-S-isoprenylcysteine O-methyltransferase Ste14
MNIIFYATYGLWLLSEILLNRLIRSGKSDKKETDKNTELFLWLTIIISIIAGVLVSTRFIFPIFLNERFMLIGIAVIILGIIFRLIAIRQLGRFFTVDVTIREDHQLMQRGLYKYLRHPSYTGSLLSFAGFGLSLNNWPGLAIIFLPVLITYIFRMNIEEKVLTEQFGLQYSDYKSRTKRLIPFIY